MKISTRIKNLVEQAELTFGVTGHLQDCIDVSLYHDGSSWHVALCRPTQRDLDRGVVMDNTCKMMESHVVFQCYDHATLSSALKELQWKLDNVDRQTDGIEYFYRSKPEPK